MKVILLEEVKGKGGEGDVVDVAQGFAVNYLLPRGLAVAANRGNLKQLEQRKHNIEKRELARTTDAATILAALEGKKIIVPAKVGEEGQLFGSITNVMIAQAISDQVGVTIERKKIDLPKVIKAAGEHEITVAIYRDSKATVVIKVVDEKSYAVAKEAKVEEVVETAEETEIVEEAAE
ncbi:MAG: 50S ribosomal protein L9 [Actinobacteria bacterium]|nr:50S ribosomal protein L9 [Actinomycetota bacterium]